MFIKSNAVKDAASEINTIINDEDYDSSIRSIAKENDFCVGVYENEDTQIADLSLLFSSNKDDFRCRIGDIKKDTKVIAQLQQEVKENGGTASKLIEVDAAQGEAPVKEGVGAAENTAVPQNPKMQEFKNKVLRNMTYISVVEGERTGILKTIIIDAQLTPVNATIDTIQGQFIIITLILIFIAIGLALYLSKRIASPIIQMNEKAKSLAKGQYNVEFLGEGYQEINELSTTLNYAAKELSKVEELRRELIANMSHDLRTPLTMISGYGEVMRDIPGENTPENIQIIIDETTRLTSLVNDMLDLSKLQAGVMTLQETRFNITWEIKNIITRYDKLLSNQEIKIQFDYEEDFWIQGDFLKLSQVIYNLINNAINYSGEDHLVIIRQIRKENEVMIQFIDHGEGIEESMLPYIWERYYKVDKTHKRSKVGSGLGLSIVKAVLELHHAEYGVESKLQKGTTFWFCFPIDKVE